MRRRAMMALWALMAAGLMMAHYGVRDAARNWDGWTGTFTDATAIEVENAMRDESGLCWAAYAQSMPEELMAVAASGRTADAPALRFRGELAAAIHLPLVSGRLPMDGELRYCALDRDTAFRLFFSASPLGERIALGGMDYEVVGVFDGASPLVILPAKDADPVHRLALRGGGRDDLLSALQSLGAEADPFELGGAERAALMRLMGAMPLALALGMGLAWLRRRGGRWRLAGSVLLWALGLGLLYGAMRSVPVRLLPARWSDFAFYGEQLRAFARRASRFSDARDAMIRADWLRAAGWTGLATVAVYMEGRMLRCEERR